MIYEYIKFHSSSIQRHKNKTMWKKKYYLRVNYKMHSLTLSSEELIFQITRQHRCFNPNILTISFQLILRYKMTNMTISFYQRLLKNRFFLRNYSCYILWVYALVLSIGVRETTLVILIQINCQGWTVFSTALHTNETQWCHTIA